MYVSSIVLGVWDAFLKQPALPGKARQTKKNLKKKLLKKIPNEKKVVQK
jgi:hypothetical protein